MNCFLRWILGEVRKDSRFPFQVFPATQHKHTGQGRIFMKAFLHEKKSVRHVGEWDTWESDVWKEKIPVIY